MKKIHLRVLFLLLLSFNLSAEMTVHMLGSYKKTYAKADRFLNNENYDAALPLFLSIDSFDKNNANVKFKIGLCYLNSALEDKVKSIPYFIEASKNIGDGYNKNDIKEQRAPKTTYKFLAKAYQFNYEFDKAIANYLRYKETLGSNRKITAEVEDIMHSIESCTNGADLIKSPKSVKISNLGGNINTNYSEYSSVLSVDANTITFTSKRFGGPGHNKNNKGLYDADVYVSEFDGNTWKEATKLVGVINSFNNDGAVNLADEGQTMIIFKDDGNDGNLYLSNNVNGEWKTPVYWGVGINSVADETSACLSVDGRILYFVSDRDGGFGGKDIYKCLRLPNGKWGPPQNLGPIVNTKYDEDGVFVSPTENEIFFSSKGHKTMGGYDVFSSVIDSENGFLSPPLNVGYPINTTGDDLYYKNINITTAYISSDRANGIGGMDIYQIKTEENEQRDITLIVGRIINNSKEDLSDNLILVVDKHTHEIVQEIEANNATGKFGIDLPIGSTYQIQYFVKGKEILNEVIETNKGSGYKVLVRDIPYGTCEK
jgi:hypothetical protein